MKHKDSTPLAVLMPLFTDILQLLVEQTNLYYQQYLDKQSRPSCLADMTLLTIMTSLALALQMEHDLTDCSRAARVRIQGLPSPDERCGTAHTMRT
jgi:hypothetical protein